MLSHKIQAAIELFEELEMQELVDILTQAPDSHFVIVAALVESYLTVDILDDAAIKEFTPEIKARIKSKWKRHRIIMRDTIFRRIGESTVSMRQRIRANHQEIFFKLMTGFLLVFCAAYITAITFFDVPKENVRYADTVLGFLLGTIMSTVINYFFGSSASQPTDDNDTPSSNTSSKDGGDDGPNNA